MPVLKRYGPKPTTPLPSRTEFIDPPASTRGMDAATEPTEPVAEFQDRTRATAAFKTGTSRGESKR